MLLSLIIMTLTALPIGDVSMCGLKIGYNQKVLEYLKLQVEAKDADVVKFKTENGNDFSVTCQNGKIVFMENDWLQSNYARDPLYTDFQFGRTSLADIRREFGTNGFVYKSMAMFTSGDYLIGFNCFEFESPDNEILVLITRCPLSTNVSESAIAEKMMLDAIIIADKSYLDQEWGVNKIYDSNYKKIKR